MEEEYEYYEPKLEEFYLGFEFEYQQINDRYDEIGFDPFWSKTIFDDSWIDILTGENEYNYRVKYLDKADIEDLGWKLIPNDDTRLKMPVDLTFGFTSESGHNYRLEFRPKSRWYDAPSIIILIDHSAYNHSLHLQYELYFVGHINNKSEFKKLLSWMKLR